MRYDREDFDRALELIVGIIGSILFVILLLYRLKNGRKAVKLRWRAQKQKEAAA